MCDRRRFTHLIGGQIHFRGAGGADEVIARLAGQQHGVVARSQLLEIGLGRRAVEARIASGRLVVIHPGVYAVGHLALRPEAFALAAVLATSPGSAASHWTAAWLHGLVGAAHKPPHVTTTKQRRARRGVAIHRGNLPPEELGVMRGIIVTSAPRTLLDLSGVATEPRLRRLVKEAEFQSLCDAESLHEVLARHPRKRGRRTLARLVEDHVLAGRATRSEMEDRFLAFCAHRDLPLPETNVALEIGGRRFEVDCLWRGERVALELDGRRAHATDTAFESDRERDRMLLAAGWTPTRATWTQLHQYGDALEADLRTILRRFRPRIGA